jgi:hypothetical protein
MIYPGKYGDGETIVVWDSPMLSDAARAKCVKYAAAIIEAWQRAVMEG